MLSYLLLADGDITPPAGTSISQVIQGGENTEFILLSDGTVKVLGAYDGDLYTTLHDIGLTGISEIIAYNNEEEANIPISVFFRRSSISDNTTGNEVFALGSNFNGQLGLNSSTTFFSTPQLITFPSGVQFLDIVPAYNRTYFIDNSGNVWGAGTQAYGVLGNGQTLGQSLSIVQCSLVTKSVYLIAPTRESVTFIYALAYQPESIGRNNFGQLGDGSFVNSETALVEVIGPFLGQNIIKSYSFLHSNFFITNSNTYAVGRNQYGKLGVGDNIDKNIPTISGHGQNIHSTVSFSYSQLGSDLVEIGFGTGNTFTTINSNISHFSVKRYIGDTDRILALKINGSVEGRGNNTYGTLGDGTSVTATNFVNTVGVSACTNIITSTRRTYFQEGSITKVSGEHFGLIPTTL